MSCCQRAADLNNNLALENLAECEAQIVRAYDNSVLLSLANIADVCSGSILEFIVSSDVNVCLQSSISINH